MSKKIFLQLVVILSLIVPSFVLAQTNKIEKYTVKKGDTLWSISQEELGDSFLWPKVWKANPEISNPDRLYPGQIVKIPIYLKQAVREEPVAVKKMPEKKAKAEVKPVEIPLKPLVNDNLLAASGYISETVPSVGAVDGSASGRSLFGEYDLVFLKTDQPAQVGDKFFVIKAVKLEKPMATRSDGYIIEPMAVVEVTKIEGNDTVAKIVKSFGAVRTGDPLDTYYDLRSPLTTDSFRKPDIEGEIIAARDLHLLNALFDVVYLDKGKKDGMEIGDLFGTVDVRSGHTIATGMIQVIRTKDTTSTAVVRGNRGGAISAGNLFRQLK